MTAPSTRRAPRRETLNIRIRRSDRGLIDQAARAVGKNRTDFVLDAARKDGTRAYALDVRPDRVSMELGANDRRVAVTYGYDGQLMSRDIRAATGVPATPIPLTDIDPGAIERMARTARRAVGSKGLADVQYALLSLEPKGFSLYLAPGSDPPYVIADLHGRHLTWPGRH